MTWSILLVELSDPASTRHLAHPLSHKWWGAIIVLALLVLLSGCWTPWLAKLRYATFNEKVKRSTGQQKEHNEKSRDLWAARKDKSAFGLLLGKDQRLSSSKTVAFLWTALVAWILVVLILTWPSDWDAALTNLYPTYLLLLGGPFASLVLSKGIVVGRTDSGALNKTTGDGQARLIDLVANDEGQADLFDVQFVLFNVVAMWFSIEAFSKATLGGFPDIPSGLVLLTGGPAAIYLTNKMFASSSTSIATVTPQKVRLNDTFEIVGSDFLAGYVKGITQEGTAVIEVGGRKVECDFSKWTNTRITARVPSSFEPLNEALDVKVVGPSGNSAILSEGLTVLS